MADERYFRVTKDTSLPRAFRAVRDNSGTVYDYETEGVAYSAGEPVRESDIDPRVVERYDNGDEHLNSLLEEISADDVDDYVAQVRADNELVKLPEHTVEAYVFGTDPEEPYTLLSTEEAGEKANEAFEEDAKRVDEARENAEFQVDAVEEEDAPNAIDFATAKAEADKAAGKAQNVTKQVAEGDLEVSKSKKSSSKKSKSDASETTKVGQAAGSTSEQGEEKKDS